MYNDSPKCLRIYLGIYRELWMGKGDMKIFKVLEHKGQLFVRGDKVKAVFDNGREVIGEIKQYGEYNMNDGIKDAVEIGEYCVALSDVKDISKLQKRRA